jgi:hypothetical protein
MGRFGDLRERLSAAKPPYQSITARYQQWRPFSWPDRATFGRYTTETGTIVPRESPGAVDEPDGTLLMWRAWPDRARVEHVGGDSDGAFSIICSGSCWEWSPRAGASCVTARSGPLSDVFDPYRLLFTTAQLGGLFRLEELGRGTRAGRPTVLVDAHDEGSDRFFGRRPRFPVGLRSDRYRLELDVEHEVVLAWHTIVDGRIWPQLVAAEITYDAPLPDALFAFAPPPNTPLDRGITAMAAREWTIEEAQAVAPFVILVLREPPRGWTQQVRYIDDSEVSRVGPEVDLRYWSSEEEKALILIQRAASTSTEPDPDDGWIRTATGGGIAYVRGGDGQQVDTQLVVEQQGTKVFMHSRTLDREALIGLSRLLTPAPIGH